MQIIAKERVTIASLVEKALPADIIELLTDALRNGYEFAYVMSVLQDGGYKIVVVPDMAGVNLGPEDDGQPHLASSAEMAKSLVPYIKAAEKRFTLGPMYIPDMTDAHGEWTDTEELQNAVWGYVQSNDRRIRLQHNVEIVAGEWVEILTWPYPVEVPMFDTDGAVHMMSFPAGTVFLGVIWEEWAWELVKQGKVRGYSIGGKAQRVLVDLPEA